MITPEYLVTKFFFFKSVKVLITCKRLNHHCCTNQQSAFVVCVSYDFVPVPAKTEKQEYVLLIT